MSAGPLKRLSSSTLDILEDGDLIPWTFVSPQAERSDNEATTYTTAGLANKRRSVHKKKKSNVEVKSTSEADSNEWTDEEEYCLCQVVAISIQNASGSQSSNDTVNNSQENQSTPRSSHGDLAETLLVKNMTKELQSVNISQMLAECFIPTHGHTDIIARVKSGAFRRKFLGFLRSKSEQNKRPLTGIKPEELEVISGEVGSPDNSRDELQDEKQQELQKLPSTLRECLSANRSNKKFKRENQSKYGELKQIATEESDPNSADGDKDCIIKCSTRQPVKETVLRRDRSSSKGDVHIGDKHQVSKRTSSRLKKKQQQSTDADTDGDKLNSSHISTNLADDESSQSAAFIKKGQEFRNDKRNEQQEEVNSEMPTPAPEGSRTGLEKSVRTAQKANGKSVSQTLSLPDNSGGIKENVRFGKQKISTEFNKAVKQPVKTNSVQQADGHEAEYINAPILAAISPTVRYSQPINVKENEKKSFKAFRKKLLDKTLEVQQNGLMLTSTFKPHASSEKTKVCEGLDKYLMLQKVQQNRKNILDACLGVQRDTT